MKIIKGIKARARRILLYGVHGCGKSTWASKSPSPFFVNLEDGVDDIECDRSTMLKTIAEVMDCLNWLLREKHDYKTAVVDTIDWLDQVINRDLCQQSGAESLSEVAGGFGKGQSRAANRWDAIVQLLNRLHKERCMGIILLSHAKSEAVKPADGDTYDKYAPDLPKAVSMMLQEWCDEVFFADFKVYVNSVKDGMTGTRGRASGGREVRVRTGETPYAYAKNRVSGMPAELPMDWDAYYKCVKNHYAKIKTGDIEAIVVDGSSKNGEHLTEIIKIEEEAREVF